MAFGRFDTKAGPMAEINTTPLVDVMLVLLVVFMIATPVVTHTIKVELPQASSQASQAPPTAIHLSITESGQYFIDNQSIKSESLTQIFQQRKHQQTQLALYIRADKHAPFDAVAQAIQQASQQGITAVGFSTKP